MLTIFLLYYHLRQNCVLLIRMFIIIVRYFLVCISICLFASFFLWSVGCNVYVVCAYGDTTNYSGTYNLPGLSHFNLICVFLFYLKILRCLIWSTKFAMALCNPRFDLFAAKNYLETRKYLMEIFNNQSKFEEYWFVITEEKQAFYNSLVLCEKVFDFDQIH